MSREEPLRLFPHGRISSRLERAGSGDGVPGFGRERYQTLTRARALTRLGHHASFVTSVPNGLVDSSG